MDMRLRSRLALVAVVLAAATTGGQITQAHAVSAKTCSAGYVLAHLSWGTKCLRAGEFCKVGNREYLRYHFDCPATGHLRRR
jgi:hypothetical protein